MDTESHNPTCMAPSMVMSRWPPRIIANDSSLPKNAAPGIVVTVSIPRNGI